MFQWQDFRHIADELMLKPDEAYLRCTASRNYYSLFGSTREYLINVLHKQEFESRKNIHQKVYDELIHSDDLNEISLAECLNYLRRVRNHADYDMMNDSPLYFEKNLDKVVENVNEGFDLLNVLKNNPPFKL